MTLGEAVCTLKNMEAQIRYFDYPTIEQLIIMKQILMIIEELETPELVGDNVDLRNKLQQYNN
jgi:hypothetical protein